MPHATENSSQPLVNGETHSKFISHVTSYPVVKDGIDTYKSHPYGRKSLDLADSAYQRFAKPVEPYLETPYSYAKPYVARADELADSGLDKVDSHFPIVKENTSTIIDTGKGYILWPVRLAGDSANYVLSTWNDEYKKTANHNNRGPGLSTSALAIVSTELKIASDFFQAVADFLGPKYQDSKKQGSDILNNVQNTAEQYKKAGEEKLSEVQKAGQQKGEQAKQEAQKAKDEAQKKANANSK